MAVAVKPRYEFDELGSWPMRHDEKPRYEFDELGSWPMRHKEETKAISTIMEGLLANQTRLEFGNSIILKSTS